MSQNHSLTGRLASSAIYTLFVGRFERSFGFDKEAILFIMARGVKRLSLCGPVDLVLMYQII